MTSDKLWVLPWVDTKPLFDFVASTRIQADGCLRGMNHISLSIRNSLFRPPVFLRFLKFRSGIFETFQCWGTQVSVGRESGKWGAWGADEDALGNPLVSRNCLRTHDLLDLAIEENLF